ncbi:MAG: hypothetical protein ACRDBM_06135, partial [Sporomusa sp.]
MIRIKKAISLCLVAVMALGLVSGASVPYVFADEAEAVNAAEADSTSPEQSEDGEIQLLADTQLEDGTYNVETKSYATTTA